MAEVKYYIMYEDYAKEGSINKGINLFSEELRIVKKFNNGSVRIDPILVYKGYLEDFEGTIESLNDTKRGISVMIELTQEEAEKCDPLLIKKYITYDHKHYELLPSKLKMIVYSTYMNMPFKEINAGNIHKVVSLIPSNGEYFEIDQTDFLIQKDSMHKIRKNLAEQRVGCDVYFLTDDEEVLHKYPEDIVELEETKDGVYKMLSKKVVVIDSIPQRVACDMHNDTLRCLNEICNKSVVINMIELDNGKYKLDTNIDNLEKKGYMYVGVNLHQILYNPAIIPLLKYINIYNLTEAGYEKINIEEYMAKKDVLKYIKKPSRN